MTILMKQCKLTNQDSEMVAWIDQKGAKVGALVELKGFEENRKFWKVNEVYNPAIDAETLAEKQRMNRNSLTSIKD